jgi:hypothetical protein
MTIHRIVCLANSRKAAGRCVAGKHTDSGLWLRPVSGRRTAEISDAERRYEDGTSANVLDLIDIPILRSAASGHQAENSLIDSARRWTKAGSFPRTELARLVDQPESLWKNGYSSAGGQNDRVPAEVGMSGGSLYLVRPEYLTLQVTSVMAAGVRLGSKLRALFSYGSVRYNLGVTDIDMEKAFFAKGDGAYPLANAFLCVSLGEMYRDGYCYKLVAAIM